MTSRRDDPALSASTTTITPPPPPPVLIPPGRSLPSDASSLPDKQPRNNAATAASAAGVRALSAQAIAFYFRAPVKAFFRTRVDYLAYARSVHQAQHGQQLLRHGETSLPLARRLRFWLQGTTPGVLINAIREQGWAIVPQQVLPPLLANVGVGAVLYTSYLHILGTLHAESARASRRIYPPPEPIQTFTAGFLAGSMQSLVAAPLDAIQARYDHRDLMPKDGKGPPRSMWAFSAAKLREIGVRGIFAGWGLSFMKDGFGSAIFFSTFEYVKAQAFYRFVTWYYDALSDDTVDVLVRKRGKKAESQDNEDSEEHRRHMPRIIRPHYAIEPAFLLLAGVSASFTQQLLLHPLTHIQVKHWDHLEDLDAKAARLNSSDGSSKPKSHARWRMLRAYYRAYRETLRQCMVEATSEGLGLTRWLYRGFWWNTIRQVPSTSAGLIIFELVRRKYGFGADEVRISRDGYDILMN